MTRTMRTATLITTDGRRLELTGKAARILDGVALAIGRVDVIERGSVQIHMGPNDSIKLQVMRNQRYDVLLDIAI